MFVQILSKICAEIFGVLASIARQIIDIMHVPLQMKHVTLFLGISKKSLEPAKYLKKSIILYKELFISEKLSSVTAHRLLTFPSIMKSCVKKQEPAEIDCSKKRPSRYWSQAQNGKKIVFPNATTMPFHDPCQKLE